MTGRYVEIDQTTIDNLNGGTYKHGYIFPPQSGSFKPDEVWGAVRIGGNPTTNFINVFGF